MPVYPAGTININSLYNPGVYLQKINPQLFLNGLPTDILGIVGIASWGPVNSPVPLSSVQDAVQAFGPPQVAKHDLVTAVMAATLQGAGNFRLVRVTDGTDTAATINVVDTAGTPVNGMTVTALYSGNVGNTVQIIIGAGSKASSYKITVALPGNTPEVFDNITGSGAALWQNMVNALNSGISGLRSASKIVMASIGTSAGTPAKATYTLTGGTNGNTTITSATLIGDDTTVPRKGMYALRGQGCNVALLADADDSTKLSLQVEFGESEGIYMMLTGPAGQSMAAGVTAKNTAGIDDEDGKYCIGDWVYFFDTFNQQNRMISQQAFFGGLICSLSPEQSSLNKQIKGIVGTQKSYANQYYSPAEITLAGQNGIDVIAYNPTLGKYFAPQQGINTSSNALKRGDEYPRLTNFICYTLAQGLTPYIGMVQTTDVQARARTTIASFLQNLRNDNMIGNFSVILDGSNNPSDKQKLGYMRADVTVEYLGIIRYFLVNFEGNGQVRVSFQDAA